MFNFNPTNYLRPKGQPEYKTSESQAPQGVTNEQLAHMIGELAYQNSELRRTVVRIETKLTRMGIALGVGDTTARR